MLPRIKSPYLYDSGELIFTGDVIKVELNLKRGFLLHYHLVYGCIFDSDGEFWIKRLDAYHNAFCLPLQGFLGFVHNLSATKIGEIQSSEDYERYLSKYKEYNIFDLYPKRSFYPEEIIS